MCIYTIRYNTVNLSDFFSTARGKLSKNDCFRGYMKTTNSTTMHGVHDREVWQVSLIVLKALKFHVCFVTLNLYFT